jgi:hypothetical protein
VAVVEGGAQPVDRGMELPLDGAFRKIERRRNLTQFQSFMMAHREHEPLTRRKFRDFRFNRFPDLPAVGAFFRVRTFLGRVQHPQLRVFRERRPSGGRGAPPMVDAGIHHDPIEPGGELGIVAKPVKRPEYLDEHVLCNVFGVVMIAGKLKGDAIHHRTMPLDERMESGSIAGRRAGHEVRICRRTRAGGHCQGYDVRAELTVDRWPRAEVWGAGCGARAVRRGREARRRGPGGLLAG